LAWLVPFEPDWVSWTRNTRDFAWPTPNDERRKQGFWFIGQPPLVAPMNARVVTRLFYKLNEPPTLFCEIPCESIASHTFGGSSGVNELGQRIDLLVTDHVTPHPEFGEIGVHWQFLYHRDGFADDVTFDMFFPGLQGFFGGVPYWWDWAFTRTTEGGLIVYRTSFEPGQDTDWTTVNAFDQLFWHTISAGRTIPRNPVVP